MALDNACDECPKTFANKRNLYCHKLFHSGDKRHECHLCKKSFIQKSDLNKHSRIHTGEKPHKCTQCNFSANQSGSLKDHMKKHSGEKPHQCNQCDYATVYLHDYKEVRQYYLLSLYRIQFKHFRESHEFLITDCSLFSSPLAAVILF